MEIKNRDIIDAWAEKLGDMLWLEELGDISWLKELGDMSCQWLEEIIR